MNNSASEQTTQGLPLVKVLSALALFLILCGVGGALLAATAIPVAASVGTASNALTSTFEDLPTDIDFTKPSQQSKIVAEDGSVIATFYAENRIVVPSEEIAQSMKDAVVSIEDQRFYEHNGVDAQGIIGALVNNITGGDIAGGSTITQQYVKNALLEEGRINNDDELIAKATEQTLARKLNEARYAIALENKESKDQILTSYLNVAQFGPSEYGVEAAARYFFNTSAKDLTVGQAALLAGLTQSPNYWNPVTNPEGAQARRDTVLGKMLELGKIDQAQFDEQTAISIEDMLDITPLQNGCISGGNAAYFCDTVVSDLLNSDLLAKDRADRVNLLYRGGLTIVSTLNPKYQAAAWDSLTGYVPVDDPSGANASLVSVEPGTGKIVAMVQNTGYGEPTEDQPNLTSLNVNVGEDQGGGVGFQSGSTSKVFTLTQWLKDGYSQYDVVDATHRVFPASSWKNSCFPSYVDNYEPYNAFTYVRGPMTVLDATKNSINVAYTQMENTLDLCDIWKTTNEMGARRGDIANEKQAEEFAELGAKVGEPVPMLPVVSQVLGTNPVTPLSMASAFSTLSADGMRCTPISFTEVRDADGNVLAKQESSCERVLEQNIARQVTAILRQVPSAIVPGRPSAGKTGTTDYSKNVWFVGYTPQVAAAVWMGHISGEISLNDTNINGISSSLMDGSTIPAPIYRNYIATALADEAVEDFTAPSSVNQPKLRRQTPKQEEKKQEDATQNANVPNVVGQPYESQAGPALMQAGFSINAIYEHSDKPKDTVTRVEPNGRNVTVYVSDGTLANG